jgi:hypothetical protein
MVHARKKTLWEEYGTLAMVKVGDWVSVRECIEVGLCSDGGIGSVTEVITSTSDAVIVTAIAVKYVLTGITEKQIKIERVTVVPMPFKNKDNPGLRKRQDKRVEVKGVPVFPQRTAMQWLEQGLQTRRHERPGWLRRWSYGT